MNFFSSRTDSADTADTAETAETAETAIANNENRTRAVTRSERQKRNLAAPQRERRNPFGDRNNFPGLDRAFAFDVADFDSPNNEAGGNNTSICSYATTNTLDMSIGARAALTDHWRHVVKYGVDGEKGSNDTDSDSDDTDDHANTSDQARSYHSQQDRGGGGSEVTPRQRQRPTPDVMWNELLDATSGVDLSASSSSHSPMALNPVLAFSTDGNEAVEVSICDNDTSTYSDYFNTSKVLLLATPEKNKNIERRVLSRQEEQEEEDNDHHGGDHQHSDSNTTADSDTMDHMFRAALHIAASPTRSDGFDCTNTSFGMMHNISAVDGLEGLVGGGGGGDNNDSADWGGVDVSCISAADSERDATTPLRGSPSRSFAAWLAHTDANTSAIMESTDTPTKGPAHRFMEMGFSPAKQQRYSPAKSSRRGGRTPFNHQHYNSGFPAVSNPIFSPPRPENINHGVNTSFSSFLSPMEAQAAQLAGQMGALTTKATPFPLDYRSNSSKQSSRHNVQLKPRPRTSASLPLFGDAEIDIAPISQANLSAIEFASMDGGSFVGSSSISHANNNTNNNYNRKNPPRGSPTSTLTPSPNEKTSNSTKSTTSSRTNHDDRRRYRTVVPTRVFFNEPEDEMSRDDSFSLPTIHHSPANEEEEDFALFVDNEEARHHNMT